VSVTSAVQLPAQPTTGSSTIRPLGGDGYRSPQSYYLADIQLASDASGGTNTLNITTDPQYQSVVSLMHARMESGAADRLVQFSIFGELELVGFSVIANMVQDSDVGQNLLYSPPPVFPVARCRATVDNVDTEVFVLNLIVYNFKRDAFQKTPLNILLDGLPRGFSIQ